MDVRTILKRYDLRPSKGLGQNFLVTQAILAKIVAAAELTTDDTVLEIGAGLGTLTEQLAQIAGRVVAVEIDERLMPVLQDTLSNFDNVTLIQGDILALDPADLIDAATNQPTNQLTSQPTNQPTTHYKVVANLPYYITSAVLRHLLEASLKPLRLVITVQREVAERIVAQPGEMSLLAVSVQFYGHPQILFRIKPGSFYPSPGVESAVVRVDMHDEPPVDVEDVDAFFRVVKAGFAQRRKQLRNTLAGGLRLPSEEVTAKLREVGVDPKRRAQTLSLEEWARVAQALAPSPLRA
jgi:16S rRNA (adenine1518-N6/adenine1519-N6)-dimethyltransferase